MAEIRGKKTELAKSLLEMIHSPEVGAEDEDWIKDAMEVFSHGEE